MVDRHHPGKAPTALLQLLSDGACLTISGVEEALDLTRRQVHSAAAVLLRRNFIERSVAGCYRLTAEGLVAAASGVVITSGPKGPRDKPQEVRNTIRERAWRAMRIRRRFTVPDLVSDAASLGDKDPAESIQKYLNALGRAGYVRELPKREKGTAIGSNGFKRWMLARDTGPRAPALRSKQAAIHDFNIGEDVTCSPR